MQAFACIRFYSVFILYNITQCPQVVDLVVDAQAIGAGRVAGIVPAAGQAVVVGAPDIAGDAVTDDKAILPGDAVDAGEHVVKIRRRRLGGTRLLADKGGGDIGNDGAFRQTAPLDRGCLLYTSILGG